MTLVLCLTSRAGADGVYYPEKAYPAMPAIPVQRAMVVYKGGIETLIVESTFQTPSHNVGWIIPVPAKPTELDLADRGMLTSVAMSMRPTITHDLSQWIKPLVILLVALVPLMGVLIFSEDRKQGYTRFRWLLYIFILMLICSGAFLPSLGLEMPAGASVQISSSQRLGDYQVSVLHVDNAAALSKWLTDGGLSPLSAAAAPIVNDYVARKWCFLVARIAQDATGPATPCPIAATFAAAAPVFPMKLTALAGTTTRVELLVVADQQAAAKGFHCEVADRFHLRQGEDVGRLGQIADYFAADQTKLNIGNPDAAEWMWDNCWVTKLTADLSPAQMNGDVQIVLVKRAAHRDHLFSASARVDITTIILLLGAMVELGLVAWAFHQRRRPSLRQVNVLGCWAALLIIGAGATYKVLSVTDVITYKHWQSNNEDNMTLAAQNLADKGQLTARIDNEQIDGFLKKLSERRDDDINPYTGKRVCRERTPGNFSSRTIEGRTYFCAYDADGREYRVELPDDKPLPVP